MPIVAARGVQIYECRARTEVAAGHEWVFVAPEADLFDARGHLIGRHDAGPRWSAADGSRIRGTVKERVDAPVAGAIPWLLLAASDEGSQGAFSGILSVLRVNTAGGLAPTTGCGRDMTGASTRVAYTADYYFYRSKP